MDASNFIYSQILKGAKKKGASAEQAQIAATSGLDDYKKGIFKKASALIDKKIKEAVKRSKK